MIRQFILSLFFFAFLFSCKEASAPGSPADSGTRKCNVPKGRYINETVLKSCPDKMPYDVPNFCFKLTFNGKDSVTVDNGFENYTLPFTSTANACEFVIPKASVAGDMLFRVTSDSTFELVDTAWTKVATVSLFSKVTNPNKQSWGFKEFLNDCVIAGEYALFIDGKLQHNKLAVLVNGQLNGMRPFIGYALCYAGDCIDETDPPSKTIELIDMQGKIQTFTFKNVQGKMAIELYTVGEGKPDEKGGRPIGKMKYELRTE
jgi:hypothetical protein